MHDRALESVKHSVHGEVSWSRWLIHVLSVENSYWDTGWRWQVETSISAGELLYMWYFISKFFRIYYSHCLYFVTNYLLLTFSFYLYCPWPAKMVQGVISSTEASKEQVHKIAAEVKIKNKFRVMARPLRIMPGVPKLEMSLSLRKN